MRRPRNDPQRPFTAQPAVGLFVQWNYGRVRSANHEQGGGSHPLQVGAGQIGPTAARNHGPDWLAKLGCSDESGSGPGTGAKITRIQPADGAVVQSPARRSGQPRSQQRNVEPKMAGVGFGLFFFSSQQIEQQRPQPRLTQYARDVLVARAVPAAAAAM